MAVRTQYEWEDILMEEERIRKNLKGIYLAAFRANHPDYNIVYQDINGKRDIGGDMMDIDLSDYDYIIATPPCNWWSRTNMAARHRIASEYSQKTKHLLPDILDKLISLGKPFIVENVRNYPLFLSEGLFSKACFYYFIGRHTYWTNILLSSDVVQVDEGLHNNKSSAERQGGKNVNLVIERFLATIH